MAQRSSSSVGPTSFQPMAGRVAMARGPVLSGHDEQLGILFQTMRSACDASRSGVASRLGTSIDVIIALEGCDAAGLPPWPETSRIVRLYGEWLRMDVSPALARLRQVLDAETGHHQAAPAPLALAATVGAAVGTNPRTQIAAWPPARPQAAPRRDATNVVADAQPRSNRFPFATPRLSRRTAMLVGLPVGFLLSTIVAVATVPTALQAGFNALPEGISQTLLGKLVQTTRRIEIGPDGLKWIKVADPRTRKADRLPSPGQP